MDFKVNDHTTIENFERLGIFEEVIMFGTLWTYEKFTGESHGQKITGLICLKPENIYNSTELE